MIQFFWYCAKATSRKGGLVQHFVAGHAAGKLRSGTENPLQSAAQAATSYRYG
jgi:hypothetical protein